MQFYADKRSTDGKQAKCKDCFKNYYEFNKDKYKGKYKKGVIRKTPQTADYRYQSRYGITEAQYNEMYELQRGLCATCGNPPGVDKNGKEKKLFVDHCHVTNIVRGLLCSNCNMALGLIRDNVQTLANMIGYLQGESNAAIR